MIASNDNLVDRGKNEAKKKFTGAENDIIDIKPKAQLGQKMIFHNIDIGLIFTNCFTVESFENNLNVLKTIFSFIRL